MKFIQISELNAGAAGGGGEGEEEAYYPYVSLSFQPLSGGKAE